MDIHISSKSSLKNGWEAHVYFRIDISPENGRKDKRKELDLAKTNIFVFKENGSKYNKILTFKLDARYVLHKYFSVCLKYFLNILKTHHDIFIKKIPNMLIKIFANISEIELKF